MNILDVATKTMQTAIKAVVDSIKTTTDTTKTNVDSVKTSTASIASKQDTLMQKIQNGELKQNIVVFDAPGTYTWTCPEGVNTIVLTMFGGGGSGGTCPRNPPSSLTLNGGYGGAYIAEKPIKVTPGITYSLVVGSGGPGVVATANNSIIQGNAGGATSAFGIICNGGIGGYSQDYRYELRAIGNHPFCNNGTIPTRMELSALAIHDASKTIYGICGLSLSSTASPPIALIGGGAGFGDGGNGGDTRTEKNPIAHGAGSGANWNNQGSLDGGNGIIIIKY